MSETSKRDAVMLEFWKGDGVHVYDSEAMADEIVRLRTILAALREPGGRVIEWEDPAFPLTVADQEILAAVAAAEQEVGVRDVNLCSCCGQTHTAAVCPTAVSQLQWFPQPQTGWVCPVCGKGNAPWNPWCSCKQTVVKQEVDNNDKK